MKEIGDTSRDADNMFFMFKTPNWSGSIAVSAYATGKRIHVEITWEDETENLDSQRFLIPTCIHAAGQQPQLMHCNELEHKEHEV